jgi:kynurenine formamidase
VHKILLGANILIVENLTNLQALLAVSEFEVIALPPKFEADAGPVRAVARVP